MLGVADGAGSSSSTLHHCDEAGAKLEVSIPSFDSRPNGHVGNSGGGIVMECLDHAWSSGWCRFVWFDYRRSGGRRSGTRPFLP
jgi:hypothetical protein